MTAQALTFEQVVTRHDKVPAMESAFCDSGKPSRALFPMPFHTQMFVPESERDWRHCRDGKNRGVLCERGVGGEDDVLCHKRAS